MVRLSSLCILWAFVLASVAAHAQPSSLTLTSAVVFAGAPELIRVRAPGATSVRGEWLGHTLRFFPGAHRDEWIALAGVDVETAAGPSTLNITAQVDGKEADLSQNVTIHEAHYRTGTLSVAPKFVAPGPEALQQIEAEGKFKKDVFAKSAPEPLWHGSFRAPVAARPTDSFGTRRMFNGKLASIHKGADFRAGIGTPVHAGNSGVVVLARPLYYEGNCVVIDHGMGLYTLSMHLSRIDVHEGDHVSKGQVVGLSGATGRVTGPHLHWAVRWEGSYLDPVKLLRLNLSAIR